MANTFTDHEGKSGARQRVHLSLAVVTTLVAILAATGAAKPAPPITTCGDVITAGGGPGFPEVYTLTANLSCSGSDGIDIQASYVTLNLNGHSITGGGPTPPTYGYNYGILVYSSAGRLTNIVITGGDQGSSLVRSFTYGIQLDNVDNSTVQNVVLVNNLYGLSTDLLNQEANTVTGLKLNANTATLNLYNGFALFNSSGASVSGNIAVGNGNNGYVIGGLLIWHGSNNKVTGNVAEGNLGDGIDIYASSNNSVNGNWASGNNNAGITIYFPSSSNKVSENIAEGNTNYDLQDYDVSCGSNIWSENWFITDNPSSCID